MSEAVIEATEEVEDECVVLNGLTKFGKLADHHLELMKIVIDGDINRTKVQNLASMREAHESLLPMNCYSILNQMMQATGGPSSWFITTLRRLIIP